MGLWINIISFSLRQRVAKLCYVAMCLAVASQLRGESPVVWSRGITADAAKTASYEFSLYAINQDTLHLDGVWLYAVYAPRGRPAEVIAPFRATKDKIGIVWPHVELQVQDNVTEKWILVRKSSTSGKNISVTVKPGSDQDLFVELDAFKPFLGRFRIGKIVLSNGQESQFELKYLLPPRKGGN
jgi:hypothetical protein